MAKTKAKVKSTKTKPAIVAEVPTVEKQEVVETAPIVNTAAPVAVPVVAAAPVQPAAVETKKSGGGCWKWCACCLILLVMCCACTIGSGYLVVVKGFDIVKAVTNSKQDTTLTKVTRADAMAFNSETYFTNNPPTDLHDGTFKMTIPEAVLLKLIVGNPDTAYLADYLGIKITDGVLKFQADIGSIVKYQLDQTGGTSVLGLKVDTSNAAGIFLNFEIISDGAKAISIKTAKIGDSGIDFGSMLNNALQSYMAGSDSNTFMENVRSIRFINGAVEIVVVGDVTPTSGF